MGDTVGVDAVPERAGALVLVVEDEPEIAARGRRHSPLAAPALPWNADLPNPVAEAEEHAYVSNLYVVPQERGAGLGGALLEESVAECRRRELDCAILWSTPQSRSLHQRHGFAPDGNVLVLRYAAAGV
jgi:GNAT superfamily N-acetyltransferase